MFEVKSFTNWQLLRFNSLKKRCPQIFGFKRFENGLGKKFPDLKYFPLILAENPIFYPDFPDWKKSSKFSLNSLIGGNPAFSSRNFTEHFNLTVFIFNLMVKLYIISGRTSHLHHSPD